jgi:predicted nucleic acid-binding protein
MMLVDTNVLIAYIRTADPRLLALFQAHSAAICGIVRAELLHGVRTPKERAQVLIILATLQINSHHRARVGRSRR